MLKKFDIAVIGGGPAGLMAAGRCAELGARVILLEKNNSLGVKLLMTGGGRCNFTNNSQTRSFINELGPNASWFISAINNFGPEHIINFFQSRGLEIKVEDNNRVFPKSNKASDVLNILISYIKEGKVVVLTNSKVSKVVKKNNYVSKLILESSQEIVADKFIFASGGKSYPSSGSSGEVYNFLKDLGHNIIEARPALSQLLIKDNLIDLEGLSFSDISLIAKNNNFKSLKIRGDIIFTKKGISGPAALNLSRYLSRQNKPCNLFLDFFPDKNEEELEFEIKNIIKGNKNFNIKNVLALLLNKRMSIFLLNKIGVEENKKSDSVSKKDIRSLVKILKSSELKFIGLTGFDEAMITSGGVDLKEIDNRKMLSKIISNLYLAGEVLDLDGPTGGYNLQIAWTSGYLAASSAALS